MADTATPDTEQPTTTATILANTPTPAPPQMTGGGPQPQTEQQQTRAAIPEQPTSQGGQAPGVLLPAKRGGLAGVLDEVRNWIAGTNSNQVYIDPKTGDKYMQHPVMGAKQQWLKVAGEGLTGAAAGLAAGKGAGNHGKALLAGVQTQRALSQDAADRDQQSAEQEYARTRQSNLDKANAQVVQMQLAEGSLRMDREKTLATQDEVKWGQEMDDYYSTHHGQDLGTYTSDDVHQIADKYPDVWKAHFNDNSIRGVPQFDSNNQRTGTRFYLVQPGMDSQPVEPGTKLHQFIPSDDASKPGHMVTKDIPPGSMNQRDWETAEATQYNKLSADTDRVQKLADTAAQEEQRKQAAKEAPYRIRQMQAAADKDEAEAQAARHKDAIATSPEAQAALDTLSDGLIDGTVRSKDLAARVSGQKFNKNDVISNAMNRAAARGETFSLPVIDQEAKFAENPKVQAMLDGIDRVVGSPTERGQLDQAITLAQHAGLDGPAPINAAKLTIKKFFGDKGVKNYLTGITETRRSIAGLMGNPILGGGETDQKLQQADEMLGQNPTLENLRSAKDVLSQALGTQRDSMLKNNRYLRQRYGQAAQPGAAPPAQVSTGTTAPPQIKLANGNIGVVQNGQWVDTGKKAPQ